VTNAVDIPEGANTALHCTQAKQVQHSHQMNEGKFCLALLSSSTTLIFSSSRKEEEAKIIMSHGIAI